MSRGWPQRAVAQLWRFALPKPHGAPTGFAACRACVRAQG